MTEDKKPHVGKQAFLVSRDWELTPAESNYLAKKLAHCRAKAQKKQDARIQEYADLFGCLETGAQAKTATVRAWQESLTEREANDALEMVESLEKVLLQTCVLNAAESLIVPTGAKLSTVRDQVLRAYGVVSFFKRVRRAIDVAKFTTHKLGRFSE